MNALGIGGSSEDEELSGRVTSVEGKDKPTGNETSRHKGVAVRASVTPTPTKKKKETPSAERTRRAEPSATPSNTPSPTRARSTAEASPEPEETTSEPEPTESEPTGSATPERTTSPEPTASATETSSRQPRTIGRFTVSCSSPISVSLTPEASWADKARRNLEASRGLSQQVEPDSEAERLSQIDEELAARLDKRLNGWTETDPELLDVCVDLDIGEDEVGKMPDISTDPYAGLTDFSAYPHYDRLLQDMPSVLPR
jgi:hypothetical protein